jgi:hypothetical protein
MIENFFYLPLVSTTPVVHLGLRISPLIFEKIRNGSPGKLRGLGKLVHETSHASRKSRDTVPLNIYIFYILSSAESSLGINT